MRVWICLRLHDRRHRNQLLVQPLKGVVVAAAMDYKLFLNQILAFTDNIGYSPYFLFIKSRAGGARRCASSSVLRTYELCHS